MSASPRRPPASSSRPSTLPPARGRRPAAAPRSARVPILWNNVDIAGAAPRHRRRDDPRRHRPDRLRRQPARPRLPRGRRAAGGARRARSPPRRGLRLAPGDGRRPGAPTRSTRLASGSACSSTGGGEVLCIALDGSPDRERRAGRADDPATPRLTDDGWRALAARRSTTSPRRRARPGRRIGVPPPRGDLRRDPGRGRPTGRRDRPGPARFCLDVGHYTVGGGDPVAALRRATASGSPTSTSRTSTRPSSPVCAPGAVAGFGDAVRRAPLHGARGRRARPRRRPRRPRRARLRRLADGRAGQRLGAPVGERRDRPAGPGRGTASRECGGQARPSATEAAHEGRAPRRRPDRAAARPSPVGDARRRPAGRRRRRRRPRGRGRGRGRRDRPRRPSRPRSTRPMPSSSPRRRPPTPT